MLRASQVTLKQSLGVTGSLGRLCELRSPGLRAGPEATFRAEWTLSANAGCGFPAPRGLKREGGVWCAPVDSGSEGQPRRQRGFQGLPEPKPYNHLLERACGYCACSVHGVHSPGGFSCRPLQAGKLEPSPQREEEGTAYLSRDTVL